MRRLDTGLIWLVAACVILAAGPAAAQMLGAGPDPFRGQDVPKLVLKIYRVDDLVPVVPDYPYPGGALPTTQGENVPVHGNVSGGAVPGLMGGDGMGMGGMAMGGMAAPGMGGMGGGGMGGLGAPVGGGMMGAGGAGLGGDGGMAGPGPQGESSFPPGRPQELAYALSRIVAPETWEGAGGRGRCQAFGQRLLVLQTPEVHQQIADVLSGITSVRTLVVDAYWLVLSSPELADLAPEAQKGKPQSARVTIDADKLERYVGSAPSFRGRITCLGGQTVHIISGDRRSVVTGAIPVVGSGIGYQPQMSTLNLGVLLQVTPSLLPGEAEALLDVRSTVTHWGGSDPVRIGGGAPPATETTAEGSVAVPASEASIAVDRPNVATQQLATTVRAPLGQAVLVGGLTLQPKLQDAGDESPQIYLIVRVSRAE